VRLPVLQEHVWPMAADDCVGVGSGTVLGAVDDYPCNWGLLTSGRLQGKGTITVRYDLFIFFHTHPNIYACVPTYFTCFPLVLHHANVICKPLNVINVLFPPSKLI
jgi:hypothetical protein